MTDILRALNVSYIAGVIDSDGWVCLSKMRTGKNRKNPSYTYNLGITQAETEAVELAVKLFGGKIRVRKPHSGSTDINAQRDLYEWKCPTKTILSAIDELMPFLRIKRNRVFILSMLVSEIQGQDSWCRQGLSNDQVDSRESWYQLYKESINH